VGVTEPVEFAFMFLAPFLYVIHAFFTGISLVITTILPVRMGFGFSAGFIDMFLNWNNPMAQNPWMIFLLGTFWFIIYYVVFRFVIVKFNLKTMGREDEIETDNSVNSNSFVAQAQGIIAGLGGNNNISEFDNCITRLRLEIVDIKKVDENTLKKSGSKGIIKLGKNSLQVIIGLNVQFVADAMREVMSKQDIKRKDVIIKAPMKGYLLELKDVSDAVFAKKMLGDGFAIQPETGEVRAPFDAVVEQIFDSKHAIVLCGDNNIKVLIHVGLDTVNLQGKGFETFVNEGDKVKVGDLLIKADLDFIKENNYNTITPIVVANTDDYQEVCVINNNKIVSVGEEILNVK
jgi:PTS system N-acetylglucosamine-specific IIC component